MTYKASVFRLFVASPGDVHAERQAIVKRVHQWNDLNSHERKVVVLPVLWETHSTPELGEGPQAIINRQLADQCDFVVSVFSTRMGTPTQNAESGTAEEIDRAGNAGKPIMLYFSNSPVHPDEIDPDQLVRVREFKARTYPRGLVENYDSLEEFSDKFARQLAQTMKNMIDNEAQLESIQSELPAGIPIIIALAQGQPPEVLPSPATLKIRNVECTNKEEIPDYEEPPSLPASKADGSVLTYVTTFTSGTNKNYYRDLVEYYCKFQRFQFLCFAIENPDVDVLRDLHFEIKVENASERSVLLFSSDVPTVPQTQVQYGTLNYSWANYTLQSPSGSSQLSSAGREIELGDDGSRMNLELPVLQPKRTVYSNNSFYLGATESTTVTLNSIIYSSSAPPTSREIELCLQMVNEEITYQEILLIFGIDLS